MGATHTIYLSPHFDDAVLSCGGAISRRIRQGELVTIVTVFGGHPPSGGSSCLIHSMHDVMGNPRHIVDRRREEDRNACSVLGCRPAVLTFPDAIYRGEPDKGVFYYDTMAALFGEPVRDEAPLPAAIVEAVESMLNGVDEVFAPLGLGGHVDHRTVHRAACLMMGAGVAVHFYEEFPYGDPEYPGLKGLDTASVHSPLGEVTDNPSLTYAFQFFDDIDLDRKVQAVGEYGSQLRLIFGGEDDWADRIRSFARRFGHDGPAERIWDLSP